MGRKLFVLFAVLAAAVVTAAPTIKSAQKYEKNRLELIKPMKKGQLLLRPTFNSCSFYYGCGKLENPVLEFRKKGGAWRRAFAPVHYFEDKYTTTGLVMDEYRGSIVKLEENTAYEVRFMDGDKKLVSGSFTTWSSVVPIKKTVYLDPAKAPYIITEQGSPKGWIRYTVKNGAVIKGVPEKPVFTIKGAKYILLDDMTIKGGDNSRNVIVLDKAVGVRIRNCDISGWGRHGKAKFDSPKLAGSVQYKNSRGQYRTINYDGAIDITQGNRDIVVERCYIHDPTSRANSWYYCHPAGPQAIVCTKPDYGTVIRYNDFIGSDIHRWNDAVEGPGNFHSNGGINRDADVYGNFMIFANDDCIELDGAQQNVRCFWNRFESALCGVSIQGCMTSPIYVFENLFTGILGEYGEKNASIKTSGKNGIHPISFIFNNTFTGEGSGFRFHKELVSYVRNNVFVGGQNINATGLTKYSALSSNSVANGAVAVDGIDKDASRLVNYEKGLYHPVKVLAAEKIDNFCDAPGAVRGALQKDSDLELPYRPIPVKLDRTRISGVKVTDGAASPAEIQITATVGGKNFKSAYTIAKNSVFDWMEITPAKGVLKSGDKITFTVKFIPEKMKVRQFYRGAFSLRLADGFSRVVSVYTETDFKQPFKLVEEGNDAVYIDAFAPSKVTRTDKKKPVLRVAKNEMGVDGKVAVTEQRAIYEYTVDVPEDGRYYFLIRGYNPTGKTPRIKVKVNNTKEGVSSQQVVADRMRWTNLSPRYSVGVKVQYYDLKKGETKVTIQGVGHPLYYDGIVLAKDPEAFEPR